VFLRPSPLEIRGRDRTQATVDFDCGVHHPLRSH